MNKPPSKYHREVKKNLTALEGGFAAGELVTNFHYSSSRISKTTMLFNPAWQKRAILDGITVLTLERSFKLDLARRDRLRYTHESKTSLVTNIALGDIQ